MYKAFLAALLAAAPMLAHAQSQTATTPSGTNPVMPNLANPQMQSNMQQQPPNVRTSPSAGDAPSIPTPELKPNQPNTATPMR